jgi:hypothetical protein
MPDYSTHIDFINNHNFRPHRDYNWGIFGLILTSGPDSTILVYEPTTNPVHNIWRFVEFPCSQRYVAKYINGIGELRTFDFSKNNTYKATTRLEHYTPSIAVNTETDLSRQDLDSDNEEDSRF